MGGTDIEDALHRLDKMTQDEVLMVAAQVLKTTHGVDDRVAAVDDRVQGVSDQVQCVDERVKAVLDSAHIVIKLPCPPL